MEHRLCIALLIIAILVLIHQKAKNERRSNLRKLMYDHVMWTREFLLGRDILPRLLKNQADLGSWFASKWGAVDGSRVTDLFTKHIQIAGQIVGAMKTKKDINVLAAQWTDNASQITFLVKQITGNDIGDCMARHLKLTTQEAIDLVMGNKPAVEDFDAIVNEAMEMADRISA